jgi:hypothetical protein
MEAPRTREKWIFGAAFAIAAVVYVPRVCRTLSVVGDSAELVAAAAVWGIPHPPGYPLYTLIAHVFTRMPWFDVAFRVHLTSALFHAAAVGLVASAIELECGSIAGAALGAAVLALGRVFFQGSLYAEVFPFADVLFASLLFLAIRARRVGAAESVTTSIAFAVVLGLALAHHPMIALALPALTLLAARPLVRDLRHRKGLGLALGALIIAIVGSAYGLLAWAASRDPYVSWGDVHDVPSLIRLVARQDYGGPFQPSHHPVEGQLLDRLDVFAEATFASFGPLGIVLAGVGIWGAWRRDRTVAVAIPVAAIFTGPIFAAANAIDVHSAYRVAFFERFFGTCHVAIAVLVGIGVATVVPLLRARRSASLFGVPLLAVATLGPLAPNFARLDMSTSRAGIAYAHDLVLSTPDGSLVLLKGDMPSQAALYVCAVERRCGERIILAPGQLFMPWKRRQLSRRYPELTLPDDEDSVVATRRLALAELPRRAVFVHPELLDDAMSKDNTAVPAGLLFRVYADDAALRADLPRIRSDLGALAAGARCEGCFARQAPPRPIDEQLTRSYESALKAHVTAARELGFDAEAALLAARAHL